ncbi:MAG: hypothetical protein WC558_07280, partial [Patulibacter sp.]
HRATRSAVPWSRHDRSILAAALVVVAIAVVALTTGAGTLTTDPLLRMPDGVLPLALTGLVPLAMLLPLLDRTGTSA